MPSYYLIIALLLIGGSIGVLVLFGLKALDDKDRFKQTMKRAQGQTLVDEREDRLDQPFIERALTPVVSKFLPMARSFTPSGYSDKVRVKMIKLGKPNNDAVDKFLAVRLLILVGVPFIGILMFFTVLEETLIGVLGSFFLAFLVWCLLLLLFAFSPDIVLNRRVEARMRLIQQQLPDVLDLLVISVEAGLGFEQAVDRVVANVPGPLSEEMNRMIGESRSGMSRAEALRALDQRVNLPDLKSFVMAILQADKFGVSIGKVLRMQAEEMRVKRRQAAQEKAQKAPVKILVPTVLCIFPVLFIVVLGPAALRIIESF